MKKIKLKELEKIAKSERALVKFSTKWCGVCKMNEPILAELEKEYGNEINFYEIDVDATKAWEEDGNEKFAIKLVPTYHYYHHGKKLWDVNNFQSKDKFEAIFKK